MNDARVNKAAQVVKQLGEPPWLIELIFTSPIGGVYRFGAGRFACGRDPRAALSIPHTSISRSHARLEVGAGLVEVVDLRSVNGLFVNGQRVKAVAELHNGDEVRFGAVRCQVRFLSGAQQVEMPAPAVSQARPPEAGIVGCAHLQTSGEPVRTVPLSPGTYTVGRSPKCQIIVPGDDVSREHCRLQVRAESVEVTDLGSRNGTLVNNEPIHGTQLLGWNVEIAIGTHVLSLRQEAAVKGPASFLPEPTLTGARVAVEEADIPPEVYTESLLSFFSPEERKLLLARASTVQLKAGTVLLKQGDRVERLMIVLEGTLRRVSGSERRSLGEIGRHESVDLEAFLQQGVSSATIDCEDLAVVLEIQGQRLFEVLAANAALQQGLRRLSAWSAAQRLQYLARHHGIVGAPLLQVVNSMQARTVEKGETLIAAGAQSPPFVMLNSGAVQAWREVEGEKALVAALGPGDMPGIAEVVDGRPAGATYTVEAAGEVLEIDAATLRDLFEKVPALRELLTACVGGVKPRKQPALLEDPADAPPDDDDDGPPVSDFLRSKSKPPRGLGRPRVIRQHDEMDCGAASLAMVAKTYGRNISLATFRAMVHVTREGASMWSLVRAARAVGLDTIGVQTSWKGMMDSYLPAILLTQYHFVVAFRINATHIWIGDPAVGMRKVSKEEFLPQWSRTALLFRPTDRFFKHPESAPSYSKYLLMLRGSWRLLGELLSSSILLFVLGLVTPLFTQVAFDRVLVGGELNMLNIMVMAMAVVVLFQLGASTVRQYLLGHAANRFDVLFSALLYRHVLKLPLNFFMVRRVGDIITRLREIVKIREFVTGDTINTVIQLASIVVYLVALTLYSVKLGALVAALVPVFGFVMVLMTKRLKRGYEEYFVDQARVQSFIVEQFRALETIKSMHAEIPARWRWETAFRKELATRFGLEKLRVWLVSAASGLDSLATTGILYVAASMAMEGTLTVGQVIASGQFVALILGPVSDLAQRWSQLQETAVAFGRVDDVITTSPEPSNPVEERSLQRRLNGDIRFQDVWFQYGSDMSPWVLKGVNLEIRAGETVALVGRSGSGKTTLAQMINLLYRPTRGVITIGGLDVCEIPLRDLRESVGIVMQDSYLFAGTVFDNVTFGHENPSMDLAIEAARVANAHPFITTLKGGYQAVLAEAGSGLSGGQRQRLNIARALYRRPSILVLDEATSALDNESERAVVDAMRVFCTGRTSIIIAHRLSTILHADRIIFLERGRVLEQGTHAELIRAGGEYAAVFGAQLSL